jgi:hypothetical protein
MTGFFGEFFHNNVAMMVTQLGTNQKKIVLLTRTQ